MVHEDARTGGRALRASAGTFAALRHRNYRLFFCGQLVSLCGTWMQNVAQPWLVYELTGSKLLLGLVSAINHAPVLILSFVGGVTADRYPKRYVMLCTQVCLMATAFLYWFLVANHLITVAWIMALSLFSGIASAFDVPTRQSFVVEMVGKEDLMNAIALNSSMFNAARIIGPSLGGIMIGSLGIARCFLFNGLSFIAVIVAICLMNLRAQPARERSGTVVKEILAGIRFAGGQPVVRATLIICAISSVFGAPYMVLLPAFANDVFQTGARGLGFMMAASGIGALAGALGLASLGDYRRKGALLLGCVLLFSVTMQVFGWSQWLSLSIFSLVVAGSCMTLYRSVANTLVQTTAPDELRGRMMALFHLGFAGMAPLGSLQAGFVAQYFGVHMAIGIGAAIMGLAGLWVLFVVPQLREA